MIKSGMHTFRTVLVVIAILLCLAVIVSTGYTNLWFYEDAAASETLSMGNLSYSIAKGDFPLNGFNNGSTDTVNFLLDSQSSIDNHLRIGYTFSFRDKQGNYLAVPIPKDSIHISINGVRTDTGYVSLSSNSVEQIEVLDYEKDFIVLREPTGSLLAISGDNKQIAGEIKVSYDTLALSEEIPKDARLYLILVPEYIQATGPALEEFSEYGWA